jgi:hypothetical protein
MIHDLFTWNHMGRINAVEYAVNKKIIETGRMPNGKKATPARLEELRRRNEQIKK